MNRTWFTLLSSTSNKSLLVVSKDNLRQDNASIKTIFVVLAVPDLFIVTDDIRFEGTSRKIDNGGEVNIPLVEILLIQTSECLLLLNQIVVVDVTIDTTRSETGVIFKPVDATDPIHVTLALIVLRTVLGVEIVHPDRVGAVSASKEVTAVAKLDLFASFDLQGTWLRRKFLA